MNFPWGRTRGSPLRVAKMDSPWGRTRGSPLRVAKMNFPWGGTRGSPLRVGKMDSPWQTLHLDTFQRLVLEDKRKASTNFMVLLQEGLEMVEKAISTHLH